MFCWRLDFIGTCGCNCVLDTFFHDCNILTQVLNFLHYWLLALKLNNYMSRNKNNDFSNIVHWYCYVLSTLRIELNVGLKLCNPFFCLHKRLVDWNNTLSYNCYMFHLRKNNLSKHDIEEVWEHRPMPIRTGVKYRNKATMKSNYFLIAKPF